MIARLEEIMGGMVVEKTIIIGALAILEAFELNLSRLKLFGFVNTLARVAYIAGIDRVENEELKSPDDIGGVFNVARFFEAAERDGLDIIVAVERADDDKSRVSIALKFLKLTDRIINAEFSRILGRGNNLKIVKADDRSFLLNRAERFK